MSISLLNCSLMNRPDNSDGWQKACHKVFDNVWHISPHIGFEERLLRLARDIRPDVIFLQLQAEGLLSVQGAKELASIGFTVQFSGDKRVESPPQHYLDLGRHIHLSLFTNQEDVDGCRAAGVASQWLEIGYDPMIFYPLTRDKKWDVIACMNNYDTFPLSLFRKEVAQALHEEFGSKFALFGNMRGAIGNTNGNQVQECANYNHSKISVSVSHFQTQKYSSDRLLRSLGSGCFTLQHYYPGVEDVYIQGKHLVTFTSIPDMLDKTKYFLEHSEERDMIAGAGSEYVSKTYTFEHMARNILKLYKERV